jgi:hypothetical protein
MNERAELLQRAGRDAEARAASAPLRSMGYHALS